MLDLAFAWLAGLVTIAAPCTLPVLPILLGASVGRRSTARPLAIALGFVIAFSAVALALGALTKIVDVGPGLLRSGAALLLLGFGVLMVWPAVFERVSLRLTGLINGGAAGAVEREGVLGGLMLGATLGLVWTPCAGPVLGSILTLIATARDSAWAGLLLVTYAIGAAVPMLAIAYGGQAVTTRLRSVARFAPRLQQAFGVIVIGFALAAYFQYDALIVARLSAFYPTGQSGL